MEHSAPVPAPGPAARELVDITLSFLEVVIHNVLFYRQVYPPGLFERRRSYGMAVWMSRHPGLNNSIHRVLHSLRAPLLKGVVEAVCLVILNAAGRAVERYTLDVCLTAPDTPATYSDLETMLAAAVTKLALLESAGGPPLGEDATFTVLVKMHEVCVGPHDGSGAIAPSAAAAAGGPSLLLTPGGLWSRVDPGDPEAVGVAVAPPAAAGGAGRALPGAQTAAGGVRVIKTVHAGPLFLRLHSAAAAAASAAVAPA